MTLYDQNDRQFVGPYISDKKFGIFSKKSEPKEQKIEIPKMMEDPKSRKREIESGLMDVFLERQEHGLTEFHPPISNIGGQHISL